MGPCCSSKFRGFGGHTASAISLSSFQLSLRVTPLAFWETMRILLVDDEPDFLNLVGHWLKLQGHGSRATSDSREVLGLMEAEHFDLVCLDLLMPYVDGLQLIAKIHQRQPGCRVL